MSALILDNIANYFGWPRSTRDEWGRIITAGQFGSGVFYVSCDNNGLVNASCVVYNGSNTARNNFLVYASDPNLFNQLKEYFNGQH